MPYFILHGGSPFVPVYCQVLKNSNRDFCSWKIVLQITLYRSQGRPVFLFPSFSLLYIRILVYTHHSFLRNDQLICDESARGTFQYLQSYILRKDQRFALYLRACIHIYPKLIIYIYIYVINFALAFYLFRFVSTVQ